MKERILQVMADIDANRLLDLIDQDICEMATLATDAEITRQFETIQKELEVNLKRYIKEMQDADRIS
tara:strand:- start:458 stop:658 length:201 start_codon:yes stop_codon:yes gene_type:complete